MLWWGRGSVGQGTMWKRTRKKSWVFDCWLIDDGKVGKMDDLARAGGSGGWVGRVGGGGERGWWMGWRMGLGDGWEDGSGAIMEVGVMWIFVAGKIIYVIYINIFRRSNN